MKKMMTVLAVLTLSITSSAAFATTYKCASPKNAEGGVLLGGPGYEFDIDDNGVVLKEVVGIDEGRPATVQVVGEMTKVSQEVEFATFELGNVSATVGKCFTQIWSECANIDVHVGNENYTAICK